MIKIERIDPSVDHGWPIEARNLDEAYEILAARLGTRRFLQLRRFAYSPWGTQRRVRLIKPRHPVLKRQLALRENTVHIGDWPDLRLVFGGHDSVDLGDTDRL